MPTPTHNAIPRHGWILYDAQCGFCSRSVRLWQSTVERHGFAVKSLQSAQAENIVRLPDENLLDDIRLLTPSGSLISGADCYLQIARRIWWLWPFYIVFSVPGFHWLLRRAYRWVNHNRYRISGTCELPTKRQL